MMLSLNVRIPFASNLGQRPPYLQHIASLAVVEAIRSQPGYEVLYINKYNMTCYKTNIDELN